MKSHSGITPWKRSLAVAFLYITCTFISLNIPQKPGLDGLGSRRTSSRGPSSHRGLRTTQHRASTYIRLVHVITSLRQMHTHRTVQTKDTRSKRSRQTVHLPFLYSKEPSWAGSLASALWGVSSALHQGGAQSSHRKRLSSQGPHSGFQGITAQPATTGGAPPSPLKFELRARPLFIFKIGHQLIFQVAGNLARIG